MSVSVKGISSLLDGMQKAANDFDNAIDKGVVATASEIQREAITSINDQSPGAVGPKRGNRRHIISKEGHAPNTDKGGLVRSITVSHAKGSQVALVFSDLDYGAYLEMVLNRPWLRPALEKKGRNLDDNIASMIKKAGF